MQCDEGFEEGLTTLNMDESEEVTFTALVPYAPAEMQVEQGAPTSMFPVDSVAPVRPGKPTVRTFSSEHSEAISPGPALLRSTGTDGSGAAVDSTCEITLR